MLCLYAALAILSPWAFIIGCWLNPNLESPDLNSFCVPGFTNSSYASFIPSLFALGLGRAPGFILGDNGLGLVKGLVPGEVSGLVVGLDGATGAAGMLTGASSYNLCHRLGFDDGLIFLPNISSSLLL